MTLSQLDDAASLGERTEANIQVSDSNANICYVLISAKISFNFHFKISTLFRSMREHPTCPQPPKFHIGHGSVLQII